MKLQHYIGIGLLAVVLSVGTAFAFLSFSHKGELGAATGPDISSPYLQWGGVEMWNASVSINTATSSVLCSIQNTSGATTSLAFFGAHINTNGIAQNQTFDISKSSTAYGTSSPAFIKAGAITGSAQKDVAWETGNGTTTASGILGSDSFLKTGETPFLVAPNEYVNFKIASGTPGTFSSYYSGNCGMSGRVLGR